MNYQINIQKTEKSRIGGVDFDNIPFGRIFADHMFIADYYDGDWRDCRILPYGKLSLSPAISAIHYGQSIFEGLKAFLDEQNNIQIFRPDKNWERMNKSARRMAMPEIPKDLFFSAIRELLTLDKQWVPTNEGSSLYIRPYMFATDDYIGIKPSDNFKFIVFCCPVGAYYSHPVKVLVSDRYVRAVKGGVGAAKTAGNYAATMAPLQEARKEGYDQILWLDALQFKYVQEIGTMNVFFQIGDKFVTPTLEAGTILDGVTRDSVIQLLHDKDIDVEVRDLSIDELVAAYDNGYLTDAFGTGTAATIAPISMMGYKDKRMVFPEVSEREISNSIKDEMEDLKHARIPDRHNWLYKVETEVVTGQESH